MYVHILHHNHIFSIVQIIFLFPMTVSKNLHEKRLLPTSKTLYTYDKNLTTVNSKATSLLRIWAYKLCIAVSLSSVEGGGGMSHWIQVCTHLHVKIEFIQTLSPPKPLQKLQGGAGEHIFFPSLLPVQELYPYNEIHICPLCFVFVIQNPAHAPPA